MAFSKVIGAQVTGLTGNIVRVEVDRTRGLHSFNIVGLAGQAVEESRERVCSALKNSGFENIKSQNQKIVLSLSPSDLRKDGSFFDLAMAIALLLSSGELKAETDDMVFVGELSLDGSLRPVRGILPITMEAKLSGFERIVVPFENASEASLVENIKVFGAKNIREIVNALQNRKIEKNSNENFSDKNKIPEYEREDIVIVDEKEIIDFSDIRGQESAKRGLVVGAAGGHNALLYGPPGTGKTMLAKAFAGILPQLSHTDSLTVTGILSAVGKLKTNKNQNLVTFPPFRAPHHSSSYTAMIGGGSYPKPGEVTLAHKGVLFLDEFPEFDRKVIESLREPIEEHVVNISRSNNSEIFPSDFILIGAMNPCPCGFHGSKIKDCLCSPFEITRYRKKISGPILDRIDITLPVEHVSFEKITKSYGKNNSAKNILNFESDNSLKQIQPTQMLSSQIREKISEAREIQKERLRFHSINKEKNSDLSAKELSRVVKLSEPVEILLNTYAEKFSLSIRSYLKIIKISQTIADLENSDKIKESHVLEAFQYRPKFFD